MAQSEGVPAEFLDNLFDVPLASRVELDGKFLGDVLLVLSRGGSVQLLKFTADGADFDETQRAKWLDYLRLPKVLGPCESACPAGLVSVHYSLENTLLSILTHKAEQAESLFHTQPTAGSYGTILRNQLNISGAERGELSGRYALDLSGSVADWTTMGSLALFKDSGTDSGIQHSVSQLYAQREFAGNFLRAGYFSPDTQGIIKLPRSMDGRSDLTLGVMAGSSDTLKVNAGFASSYPLYVTADRESRVDIYRNGMLLNSQTVQPGLQLVNTQVLPEGIYEAEIRLFEDGVLKSSKKEWIYKSSSWGNPEQRWRYNVFAGQQRSLFSHASQEGRYVLGGILNYLLHPMAILGLSSQRTGDENALGLSLDLDINEQIRVSSNIYNSSAHGKGGDLQFFANYDSGSVLLSMNKSWPDLAVRETEQTIAVAWQHQLNDANSLAMRLADSKGGIQGLSRDVSYSRRQKMLDSDASVRLSLFDRPSGLQSQRSRGFELSLNLSFGREGRSYSGSMGSRNNNQNQRDHYASLSMRQELDQPVLKQVGLGLTGDSYGVGLNGSARFQHPLVHGDAYLSRSSFNNSLSGGLNLENTLALSGNHLALSGYGISSGISTGMIVDVDSDFPDLSLQAYDKAGGIFTIRPGRNLLPVAPYLAGTMNFNFKGRDAPQASISPTIARYHLNKGGVAHAQIRVMQIVTLLGRIVGADGQAIKGAALINHAGRTVSEANGFFTIEVSEKTPELEIKVNGASACHFRLAEGTYRREGGVIFVGNIVCAAS